jgi:hypothetical protein
MRYLRHVVRAGLFICIAAGALAGFLAAFPFDAQAEEADLCKPLTPEKRRLIYETILRERASASVPRPAPVPVEQARKAEPPRPKISRPATTGTANISTNKATEPLEINGIELREEFEGRQFTFEGTSIYLFTDPKANRVRIMTPLARLDELRRDPDFSETELLQSMMKANYLATGDLRLCVNKGIIWAAFLHPLDSLTKRDLDGAMKQLAEAAQP